MNNYNNRTTLFFTIFSIAVLTRLLFYFAANDIVSVTDDFIMRYDQIADNLLTGNGFITDNGKPASTSSPLYPAALSVIYFIFGHSLIAVRIFSIFFDAAAAALIAVCARMIFNNSSAGFWTGIVAALHPTFIYSSLTIGNEPIFLIFHALSLFLLLEAFRSERQSLFIMSGIAVGAATLGRTISLFLPFWLFPFFFINFKNKKRMLSCYFAFVISAYLVIAPWTYRNYLAFNMFMPVQSIGGINFYIGTFPPEKIQQEGYSANLSSALSHEIFKEKHYSLEEKDKLLFKLGISRITGNPFEYVKIIFIRFGTMWFTDFMGKIGIKHLIIHGLFLILFISGCFVLFKKKHFGLYKEYPGGLLLLLGGYMAYNIAMALIMVADARFTVSAQQVMFPVIGLFAGYYIEKIGIFNNFSFPLSSYVIKQQNIKRYGKLCGIIFVGGILLFSFLKVENSKSDYIKMGNDELAENHVDQAMMYYNAAAAISFDADVAGRIGTAYLKKKELSGHSYYLEYAKPYF